MSGPTTKAEAESERRRLTEAAAVERARDMARIEYVRKLRALKETEP